MKSYAMPGSLRCTTRTVILFLVVAVLAACMNSQYTRGLFQGYVMDQTQEAVSERFGKPDEIDNSDAKHPKWTYNKKTFDPDNANQSDARTTLHFDEKGGKMVVVDVSYT
ncbi:MAG: hypothetical protein JNM79_18565 [Burkholderiales bacterium]|nr:hypothetical protein [Burkholderiales bacterium]